MEPFGAPLIFEAIETPLPVWGNRSTNTNSTGNATTSNYYDSNGGLTTYINVTLNERTIPLNASYTQCVPRDDGWCEMTAFMDILSGLLETADYEFACFGNYSAEPFGNITNGVEPTMTTSADSSSSSASKLRKRAELLVRRGGMGSGLTRGKRDEEFLKRMSE